MKHTFEFLSGQPCTDAQEKDMDATACASDIARAAFPHLRIAMLMPLGSISSEDAGSCAECQPCDPSDVFVTSTTFAVMDLSAYTLQSCAKQGLMLASKWVFAATGRKWTNDVMRAAARGGQLEFAKWALAEGCPWGSSVMWVAAKGGHLEFAQWARAQGCPWGTDDVVYAAAKRGHLAFAQWAHEVGCGWGSDVMSVAARGGHLEFAKWARSEGCPD